MDTVNKRKFITSYSQNRTEVEFMKEVLDPLFHSMGFQLVKYNHGAGELGKDFILVQENKLGGYKYICVVVKNENIRNTSKKEMATLEEISRQVKQSEGIKVTGIIGHEDKLPAFVWVVTSGEISNTAKEEIKTGIKYIAKENLEFLDREKIIYLIDKFNPGFFSSRDPFFLSYSSSLQSTLKKDTSEDILTSKVLGKIDVSCKTFNANSSVKESKFITKKAVDIFRNSQLFWIQGDYGSGKSFTIHQYIDQEIKLLNESEAHKLTFPIHINCSNFENQSIKQTIEDSLRKHIKNYTIDDYKKIFKNYDLLIIIDEFESIIDKGGEDFVIDLINFTSKEHKKTNIRFGILSRVFTAYEKQKLNEFKIWNILETNFTQLMDTFKKDYIAKDLNKHKKYQDMVKDEG